MKINLSNIKKAKKLLNMGECIAIPTETVYGLAGNAYSDQSCKKIFKLKDIDPMVFSGAGDKNIKVIESHFNSTIVLRGNNLIVDGLKKEINDIELLIENITYTINNKGFINFKQVKFLNSNKAYEFNCLGLTIINA